MTKCLFSSFPMRGWGPYTGMLVLCGDAGSRDAVGYIVHSKQQVVDLALGLSNRDALEVIQRVAASLLPEKGDRPFMIVDGFHMLWIEQVLQGTADVPADVVAVAPPHSCITLMLSTSAGLVHHGLRNHAHGFVLVCTTEDGVEVHLGYSREQALELIHGRQHLDGWRADREPIMELLVTSELPEVSLRPKVVVEGSLASSLFRAFTLLQAHQDSL